MALPARRARSGMVVVDAPKVDGAPVGGVGAGWHDQRPDLEERAGRVGAEWVVSARG